MYPNISGLTRLSVTLLWIGFITSIVFFVHDSSNAQETSSRYQAVDWEALRQRVTDSELSEEDQKAALDRIQQGESKSNDLDARQKELALKKKELDSIDYSMSGLRTRELEYSNWEIESYDDLSLKELEQQSAGLDEKLLKAQTEFDNAKRILEQTSERRSKIEAELVRLEQQLNERKEQLTAEEIPNEGSVLADAIKADNRTAIELLRLSIETLRTEQALISAETAAGIRQLRFDVASRWLEILKAEQQNLIQKLELARSDDAKIRISRAEAQIENLPAEFQFIAKRNLELANAQLELVSKIEGAQNDLEIARTKLEAIQEEFDQAKNRVDSVGLIDAVGAMLRNLKRNLPNAGAIELRARDRQKIINEAQYELIELTDQRNRRLTISIADMFQSMDRVPTAEDQTELENRARELLQDHRSEFLDPVIRSQNTYFNTLVSASTVDSQLTDLIAEAIQFVNERVLWIRSAPSLIGKPIPARSEFWFLLPIAWENLVPNLLSDIKARFWIWLAGVLLFAELIRLRNRLREEIRTKGESAKKATHVKFGTTLNTLLLTCCAAAPFPLLLGLIGWRLRLVAGSDPATQALAEGAQLTAFGLLVLELPRQVFRSSGLAESHFGVPKSICQGLRRDLKRMVWLVSPLLFAVGFFHEGSSTLNSDTLGRYAYLAFVAITGYYFLRTSHPRIGLPSYFLRLNPDGWANRLSTLWYSLLVCIPVALLGLAIAGFYFTSQQLALKIMHTLLVSTFLALVVATILRWILLNRRKIRIDQARARASSEAAATTSNASGGGAKDDGGHVSSPTSVEGHYDDLIVQMKQTRGMVQALATGVFLVAAWGIWSDVVPALSIAEDWPLGYSTTTVTELIPGESGSSRSRTVEVSEPITVVDVALAILILFVTFVATRNLPGVLEFAVLQRLPLDPSSRYAISSMARYAIILIGMIFSGQIVGLHWGQVQWMATALTFGLAFGLQEMFANFVAGIIILFERPVRVGDVVEIDGVSGTVSQIRIRATTISNWDRKDYIVPNKEFITGKLLNWTRSDDVYRLVIDVGVAYGSDTNRAIDILQGIAAEHSEVLKDPAPQIFFNHFGDSSLGFRLHIFLDDFERRVAVNHELHMAIDAEFRAANIEIAFPQTDLHLRTISDSARDALLATIKDKNHADIPKKA